MQATLCVRVVRSYAGMKLWTFCVLCQTALHQKRGHQRKFTHRLRGEVIKVTNWLILKPLSNTWFSQFKKKYYFNSKILSKFQLIHVYSQFCGPISCKKKQKQIPFLTPCYLPLSSQRESAERQRRIYEMVETSQVPSCGSRRALQARIIIHRSLCFVVKKLSCTCHIGFNDRHAFYMIPFR